MHQPRSSHLGPQVAGKDGTPAVPYLCYSRRVVVPPHVAMEHRDGPKKPMRKKLYPSSEKFEIYVTDRVDNVWMCDVTAEQHNINRKRPGGRDESWSVQEFLDKFQEAFQRPTLNENYMFLFKEQPDSAALTLTIKERSGKIVINYNNPALLLKVGGEAAQSAVAAALAEENNLFRTHLIRGDFALVKLFVKSGVSIDPIHEHCWSPLQFTVHYGHAEISRWLVEQGCELNRVSPDGKYALGMVVEQGDLELLKLLVARGVKIEEETYENMDIETPMMLATLHQHRHIVEWMVGPQGYRTVRDAKKFGQRNTSRGTTMFETVQGHYPQVWGVTAGVDDGIREGMFG